MPRSFQQTKLTDNEKLILQKMDILINSVEKVYPQTKAFLLRSFIGGLVTALGATIGLSIILALFTFTLSQLQLIPGLKAVINQTQINRVLPK